MSITDADVYWMPRLSRGTTAVTLP